MFSMFTDASNSKFYMISKSLAIEFDKLFLRKPNTAEPSRGCHHHSLPRLSSIEKTDLVSCALQTIIR